MQMVADEHGLKMSDVFKTAVGAGVPTASASSADAPVAQAAAAGAGPLSASAEDDLEERLRKLRS